MHACARIRDTDGAVTLLYGCLPAPAVHRCATNCDGRTVKVIKDTLMYGNINADVDYSDESGGVCAIGDTTVNGRLTYDVTLTEHDDCFVMVDSGSGHDPNARPTDFYDGGFSFLVSYDMEGDYINHLLGLDGNDVLCGGSSTDHFFYGMHSGSHSCPHHSPCHALHCFPTMLAQVVTVTISSRLGPVTMGK